MQNHLLWQKRTGSKICKPPLLTVKWIWSWDVNRTELQDWATEGYDMDWHLLFYTIKPAGLILINLFWGYYCDGHVSKFSGSRTLSTLEYVDIYLIVLAKRSISDSVDWSTRCALSCLILEDQSLFKFMYRLKMRFKMFEQLSGITENAQQYWRDCEWYFNFCFIQFMI